jgi:CheY-like chemotaxis protein
LLTEVQQMAELTILLVDDAAFIRDLVKKAVRQTYPGCDLIEATNGRKAVALLDSHRFDLVLCDWEMPEMSGIEVLKWMREQPNYKATPFMMITSRGDRDHVLKAVEAGVSGYIGKPFTRDAFVDKLSRMVFRYLKVRPATVSEQAVPSADRSGASVLMGNVGNQALVGKTAPGAGRAAAVSPLLARSSRPEPVSKTGAKGQANVRFASGVEARLVIRDISLQEMIGVFRRQDALPVLLEQAVVDVIHPDNGDIARINAFVRMLQAQEPHPDAETVQIRLRFVDDDPDKLDALSRFIGQAR